MACFRDSSSCTPTNTRVLQNDMSVVWFRTGYSCRARINYCSNISICQFKNIVAVKLVAVSLRNWLVCSQYKKIDLSAVSGDPYRFRCNFLTMVCDINSACNVYTHTYTRQVVCQPYTNEILMLSINRSPLRCCKLILGWILFVTPPHEYLILRWISFGYACLMNI